MVCRMKPPKMTAHDRTHKKRIVILTNHKYGGHETARNDGTRRHPLEAYSHSDQP